MRGAPVRPAPGYAASPRPAVVHCRIYEITRRAVDPASQLSKLAHASAHREMINDKPSMPSLYVPAMPTTS